MSARDAARFFDTTGCLNLSRPTPGTSRPQPQQRRPQSSSVPIRGQPKIDLYNFDHSDFVDSKYVLTSPRSLEACARLKIKPASLLPTKLADIPTNQVRYSTLVDIRDEIELERLANLQRCREEREKIIGEQSSTRPSSAKESSSTLYHATRVRTVPPRPTSHSRSKTRSTVVKNNVVHWGTPNEPEEIRTSSSADFLDDVRRMDNRVQRLVTTKPNETREYLHGLENVKHMIALRATKSSNDQSDESANVEKKQYELLIGHYDHELKSQKARENVRRNEKEKEAERYETLMHEFMDLNMAEERRQNELRRRMDKLQHSRKLFEALQAKNHEVQMADVEKRRAELLRDIRRKDRRTENFVKDKQETVHLSRTLAKSSQDTREYLRENSENFEQKARRAEITSSILVTKAKPPIDRRYVQASIRS